MLNLASLSAEPRVMIKPTNAIGEIEKIRSRFTIGSRLRSKLKSITRFPDSLNN